MGTLKINFAEKPLLEHLLQGGKGDDELGRTLIAKIIHVAMSDRTVSRIAKEGQLSGSDLEYIYSVMIAGLLDPKIDAGGPILVPTLFFMEPVRLQVLANDINRNVARLGVSKRRFAIAQSSMDAAQSVWLAHTSVGGRRALRIRNGLIVGCAAIVAIVGIIVIYTWR